MVCSGRPVFQSYLVVLWIEVEGTKPTSCHRQPSESPPYLSCSTLSIGSLICRPPASSIRHFSTSRPIRHPLAVADHLTPRRRKDSTPLSALLGLTSVYRTIPVGYTKYMSNGSSSLSRSQAPWPSTWPPWLRRALRSLSEEGAYTAMWSLVFRCGPHILQILLD